MKTKTIHELRDDVENFLREKLESELGSADAVGRRSRSAALSRLSVIVSPLNTLSVTAIAPMFQGRTFDERTEWLWNALEANFPEAERDRVDFWLLLSPREAKAVQPTTVHPKRRSTRIPAPRP
jgi:hypothetical protein